MWSANVPATVGSPQVRAAHSTDTERARERETERKRDTHTRLAATSAARRRFGSASRARKREAAWASERYSRAREIKTALHHSATPSGTRPTVHGLYFSPHNPASLRTPAGGAALLDLAVIEMCPDTC